MSANKLTTTHDWAVGGRYQITATDAANGILLSNPNEVYTLYWTTSDTASPPTSDYYETNPILPQRSQPMTLVEGTYVWVASERPMAANIET